MKILKILIGISIMLLIIGAVSATQLDSLKAPDGYDTMLGGYSEKMDNKDVYFYIGEMEYNKDVFDNTSDCTVTELEDNIYKYIDTDVEMCGVQEKVKLDGKEYLISIVDEGSVDGDIDSYLVSLKEFNKINNLMPMEV